MTASLTARIWASGIRATTQNCVIGIFGFEVVHAREIMHTDLMISRTGTLRFVRIVHIERY
jgi:hypothetical protein